MNVLFYGSCNVSRLIEEVNSQASILVKAFENYKVTSVLCQETELSQENFLNLIHQQDIIITVPISKEYRNKYYLSTDFILKNKKLKTKVIIFISLHSHFYYFDYGHIYEDNVYIKDPHFLHFKTLFEFYKQDKTEKQFIEECVYNTDFKSYEELDFFANKDIEELSRRQDLLIELKASNENVHVIDVVTFIKNNYKNHQMFYSLNHPSNYLMYFVADEIVKEIGLQRNLINKTVKVFDDKFLLYACQQKYFNFDIYERPADFRTLSNNNNITTLEEMISHFYNSYKQQKIKKY
jgi:hypothetical protein